MLTGIITYLVSANDKLCELSYNSQTKKQTKKNIWTIADFRIW